MSAKKVVEEHRAPDDEQPIALAIAEELGTLPDVDRRHEEEIATVATVTSDEPAMVLDGGYVEADAHRNDAWVIETAGIGSVFERVAQGWKVRYVDGGTTIFVEGPSLGEAVASHGVQVKHK